MEGKLTLLKGPSGSGKTTLLRQLVGLNATEGCVRRLAGRDYTQKILPCWRGAVTLLMQDSPVLPGTIEHNLRFPFSCRSAEGRLFDDERAAELLDIVGLGGIPMDRSAGALSGGERHRLALVRGLLWSPSILVADEPLSGLDTVRAQRCFDLLLEFAHRPGRAVLCVLHDAVLGRGTDRTLNLVNGRLEAG